MTSTKNYFILAALAAALVSCQSSDNELAALEKAKQDSVETLKPADDFKYIAEQFSDLRVLRYNVPGFDQLDLKTKTLLYYLSEAALCGRDINYDQNYKYNLVIRKTLEAILSTESHDSQSEDFKKLEVYAKRMWFSNGIHHHYNSDKFIPECSADFLNMCSSMWRMTSFHYKLVNQRLILSVLLRHWFLTRQLLPRK